MNLFKFLIFAIYFVTFNAHAQMHLAFEVQLGTMSGSQPGPWTKFENPAIQSAWINGQRGYILNQEQVETVQQFLNDSVNYGNVTLEVKQEVEKIIQYFSSDNNARELIKDYIPADLRPLPLPNGVHAEKINEALDPLWDSVKNDNVLDAPQALNRVRQRLQNLSSAERSYAESELNRLFTYPTGQLKNLPYLPTSPVSFNASTGSARIKPYIDAINELQVSEAFLRKGLEHRDGIGASLQREIYRVESEKIKRALRIEEFKEHYFNTPSSFPKKVSQGLQSGRDSSELVSEAEEIIQNNSRIKLPSSEMGKSPDEALLEQTAELSSCLSRGVDCRSSRDFQGEASKEVKDIYNKVSQLYETRTRTEDIKDPELRTISQNLVSFGHDLVLKDASNSQYFIEMATNVTDFALGFIPGVGTVKDFIELVSGKSLLTGETLDFSSRAILATSVMIDMATAGTGGRLTKAAMEGAVGSVKALAHSKIGAQVGKHWDDVEAFSREVLERIVNNQFHNRVVAQSYTKLHNGLKTLPWTHKIFEVHEGVSSDKIAVIGRKMQGGVNDVANHLRRNGVDVETFNWTDEAKKDWDRLKTFYGGRIPYDEVTKTLAYKENKEWAERIVREGYTIFDIRDPLGANLIEGYSAFYDIETLIIFGKLVR